MFKKSAGSVACTFGLDFKGFLSVKGNVQVLISKGSDAAATGCAGQKAQLHQVGLVHIFQCDGLFTNGGGQGFKTYRAAAVIFDNGGEHSSVDGVKTQFIHFQPF